MQMFRDSRSIWSVVFVLGIFGWVSIARITRGTVMSTKQEEYVTASKSLGASSSKILFKHILPNSTAPIIVYATVSLGVFIVAEASLSFLALVFLPTWLAGVAIFPRLRTVCVRDLPFCSTQRAVWFLPFSVSFLWVMSSEMRSIRKRGNVNHER